MAQPFMVPCVMYDNDAEKAANFYVAVFSEVFGDASILHTARWGAGQMKELERLPAEQRPFGIGDVSYVRARLNGQEVMLANGGPHFKFNDAVSLYVSCDTQEQLDALWEKLASGGGQAVECGWLLDRFGLRWQITTRRGEPPARRPGSRTRGARAGLDPEDAENRDGRGGEGGAGGVKLRRRFYCGQAKEAAISAAVRK